MNRRAFSLIELMIVIVIFGISLMFIVPKMVEKYTENSPVKKQFEEVIQIAYNRALSSNKGIFVQGVKGGNTLSFDNETYKIDEITSFNSAKINNQLQSGLNFYFGVYPDGFVDTFEIVTSNNVKIISDSLNMKVNIVE